MKKVFLLAVMAVVIMCAQAQEAETKSIVIQQVDSLTASKVIKIENSLAGFYKQNRRSHFFILLGSALYTAGYIFNDKMNGEINFLPILGGISSLVGGVIYLDSFKHLNLKRKTKVKNYNEVYNYRNYQEIRYNTED